MSLLDPWLQPLRDYPRWFVMLSFVLMTRLIFWMLAKLLKWSAYATGLVVFSVLTGVFALWLWG
jgi:hypothetical protein